MKNNKYIKLDDVLTKNTISSKAILENGELNPGKSVQEDEAFKGARDALSDIMKEIWGMGAGEDPRINTPQPKRPKVDPLTDLPKPENNNGQSTNQNNDSDDKGQDDKDQDDKGQDDKGQNDAAHGHKELSDEEIKKNAEKAASRTKEYVEGYKRGLQDAKDGISNNQELSKDGQEGYEKAQQEAKEYMDSHTPTVDGGQTERFGQDKISTDKMKELAKNAGQSLEDSDADPIKMAQDFVKRTLKDYKPQYNPRATGGQNVTLLDKLYAAMCKLKTNINWRDKLRPFLNRASKSKRPNEYKFYKSRMGRDALNQYVKDNPIKGKVKNAISQVFYAVDGSGSMFSTHLGRKMFDFIMTEIIKLEESNGILNSSFTYYGSDGLHPDAIKKGYIRRWDNHTPRPQKLKMTDPNGNYTGGGNNMGKAIEDVFKLPKPYFDNSASDTTLLIVISDADDDMANVITHMKTWQKTKVVFMIIEEKAQNEESKAGLVAGGIPEKNIITIDRTELEEQVKNM